MFDKLRGMGVVSKILLISIIVFALSTITIGSFVYSFLTKSSIDTAASQTAEIVRQSSAYLNERLKFVSNEFNTLQLDKGFERLAKNLHSDMALYVEDMNMADSLFSRIRINDNSIIKNIVFLRADGKKFEEYANMHSANEIEFGLNTALFDDLLQRRERKMLWITQPNSNGAGTDIKLVKIISYGSDSPDGILVFTLNEKFIEKELSSINTGIKSAAVICDQNGGIVSYAQPNRRSEMEAHISGAKEQLSQEAFSFTKNRMLFVGKELAINGWRFLVISSLDDMIASFDLAVYVLVLVTIIGTLFYMLLAMLMVKFIANPIKRLELLMEEVRGGNFDIAFIRNGNDEINMLGETFNIMARDLKLLMGQIKDERESKAKLELRVLQEQIKPHFLYNILDSLYWLCISGYNDRAAQMVEHLGNYFRLGLNKGSHITTVRNEIEHVKNYLEIQKIRYNELFDYEIDADDDVLEDYILKVLIQPIVENSIYHGFFEPRIKGTIKIRSYRERDRLVIVISDTGIGFDTSRVTDFLEGERQNMYADKKLNYGLINVYDRIKLEYEKDGEISFESVIGSGSVVRIRIPSSLPELRPKGDSHE